jgi:hypothetical protein
MKIRGYWKVIKCHGCGTIQISACKKKFTCREERCLKSRRIGLCNIIYHTDHRERADKVIEDLKKEPIDSEFVTYSLRKNL